MNEGPAVRPPPVLPEDAHKGLAGRVLCVVGSRTMPGAALLVARAAQRAGAGLVAIGCLDRELLALVPTAAPEAVLVDLSADFPPALRSAGSPAPDAAARLLAREPHARLLGPGLGDDRRTRAVLELALAAPSPAPLALDADALNALDGEVERLAGCAAPLVLTPHPGEARRLAGEDVPADDEGRLACARSLARRGGGIVVLKGRGTVVSDGERGWRCTSGNAGMATAGAGDVLAGILVAYLALVGSGIDETWSAWDAARAAVRVHGLAGDLAAEALGRRAVVASDLVDFLPEAQRRLEGR